jgi:Protein of unknown function (DUF1647)
MVIVTSSSNDYFFYLRNLLHDLNLYEKNSKLIIYDLGLLPEQLQWLIDNDYEIRKFDFDLYPKFIRLDNEINDPNNIQTRVKKGCSVFKAVIINDLLKEFQTTILWMDCRLRLKNELLEIKKLINKNGCYFPTFNNKTIINGTHPFTLSYLNVEKEIHNKLLLVNQIMGWDYNKNGILRLSEDFKNYCLTEHWIKPNGANDLNHSFEYSILSILFYQYQKMHGLNSEELPKNTEPYYLTKK